MELEKARQILWDSGEELSNEEIQRVIDLLRWICRIVIDEYLNVKHSTIAEDIESEKED